VSVLVVVGVMLMALPTLRDKAVSAEPNKGAAAATATPDRSALNPLNTAADSGGQQNGTAQAERTKTDAKAPTETVVGGERPQGNCSLRGKLVSAATGKPIDHGRMYLWYVPNYCGILVNVASDGTFLFTNLAKGPYSLEASHVAGYQEVDYDPEDNPGRRMSQGFSLKDGEQRAGIVLTAEPACRISGKITDEKGKIPENSDDFLVSAWSVANDGTRLEFEGQAYARRPDGSYVIDFLSDKPVYVMALNHAAAIEGHAYPPIYYPGTLFRSEAQRITFDKRQHFDNINITLHKEGGLVLEGSVLDEAGKPVPEAFVVAYRRDMRSDFVTAYTDPQGHYAIRGVGDGPFRVHVDAVQRGLVRMRTPIDTDRARQTNQLNFTLTQGAAISGTFVDEKGHNWRIGRGRGYAVNIDKGLHGRWDASWDTGGDDFRNKYRPKDVREGSIGVFLSGEGPYDGGEMIFPTENSFILQGMMPGKTQLVFSPHKEGYKVVKVLHDGRNVLESGITTKPGQAINDVTIVIGKP